MPNKNVYNTKPLVETAILSAISVIVMFLIIYIPLFAIIGYLIIPIPAVVLYAKYGYKYSVISVLFSSTITIVISNPITGISLGILYGSIGIVLGYCIANKKKFSTTLFLVFIMCIIANTASFWINVQLVEKQSLKDSLQKQVVETRKAYDSMKSINGTSSLTKSQQEQMKSIEDKMFTVDTMLKVLPVGIILASLISALLTCFVVIFIIKKLGIEVVRRQPFSEFYFDGKVGIFLIVIISAGLILQYTNIVAGEYIINAILILAILIFLIEGMAVTTHFMKNRWHLSTVATTILMIIISTSPLILLFLYLGLADLLIDFRKIFKYKK